ncbi:Z-DNA-binding protein 1 isoform 2-T2 [Anomaloglossus baeobatrachus]
MTESNETLITADKQLPKIDCVLSDQQKEIYQYLESNGEQTALNIAKAVKKKTAKEVNPDLYKMKAMNLLELNSKVWRIKALAPKGVEGPATNGSVSGIELASKTIKLSELQESIITFLTSNKPSKAVSIAKGVGKNVAKDVNSNLYKMMELKLLCLDKEEKLWSINTGHPRKLSGSSNCSLEDSGLNQSHIEIDGVNFAVEQDTRWDSGIGVTSPCYDNTMRDEQKQTAPLTGETYLQHGCQMTSTPQNVTRNYNFNIHGCHSFTISDIICQTQGDAEIIRDGLFSAPCTSLPGPSSYLKQTFNISEICDGLGNVTLDDQDSNGDASIDQLDCTVDKVTFL